MRRLQWLGLIVIIPCLLPCGCQTSPHPTGDHLSTIKAQAEEIQTLRKDLRELKNNVEQFFDFERKHILAKKIITENVTTGSVAVFDVSSPRSLREEAEHRSCIIDRTGIAIRKDWGKPEGMRLNMSADEVNLQTPKEWTSVSSDGIFVVGRDRKSTAGLFSQAMRIVVESESGNTSSSTTTGSSFKINGKSPGVEETTYLHLDGGRYTGPSLSLRTRHGSKVGRIDTKEDKIRVQTIDSSDMPVTWEKPK